MPIHLKTIGYWASDTQAPRCFPDNSLAVCLGTKPQAQQTADITKVTCKRCLKLGIPVDWRKQNAHN